MGPYQVPKTLLKRKGYVDSRAQITNNPLVIHLSENDIVHLDNTILYTNQIGGKRI